MSRSPVSIELQGIALVVTMADPSSRNALSDAMVAALGDAVAVAQQDPAVRALVLRGANGSFCAGGALKGSGASDDLATIRETNVRGGALFRAIFDSRVPVIAVVEGPAFGGGFGLTCCADIVIAGPDANFALSETSLGLVPAQIAPFVLHRLGARTAIRLGVTGERCNAAQALSIGLADHDARDAAMVESILADRIAMIDRCAPGANAATKALFRTAGAIDAQHYAEQAADIFIEALTGEGLEGIAAFASKRKPYWREDKA